MERLRMTNTDRMTKEFVKLSNDFVNKSHPEGYVHPEGYISKVDAVHPEGYVCR